MIKNKHMTQEDHENYLNFAMIDAYDLVTETINPWPKHFTKKKKLELLNGFIGYWQSLEEYERCAELHGLRAQIEQESNKN